MPNSLSNLSSSNSNESLKELNQNQSQHSQASEGNMPGAAGVIASRFNEAATLPAATIPASNKREIDLSNNAASPPSSKKLKTDPNQRPTLAIKTDVASEHDSLLFLFKQSETGLDLLENLLQLNAISTNAPTNQNAELIETLNGFFSNNENSVDEAVLKFFKQIKQAISSIQQKAATQNTPLRKAGDLLNIAEFKIHNYKDSILMRASNPSDVASLNPGVFKQTAPEAVKPEFLKQKIAKAVSNLCLSAIRETLQNFDYSQLPTDSFNRMVNLLERIIIIKTTTGLIDGSLAQDVDTLLNAVDQLQTPLQYQIKMRAYLVSAHALVKLGGEQNRNKAIDLIEKVKLLYPEGLVQVQNMSNPFRPNGDSITAQKKSVASKELDVLMAKALTVQIMAGQAREAFEYIFSDQHTPEKQIETLLSVSELSKKNRSESASASLKETFKPTLQSAFQFIQGLDTEDVTDEKKRELIARLETEIEKFD